MSEEKIIKALIKKWWLILIVTLFCSGVTLYMVNNSMPIYQSTATLYIMASGNNQNHVITNDSIAVSQQLLKDFSELIKSEEFTSAVIQKVEIDGVTKEELRDNVSIDIQKGSSVFEVSYKDENPEQAKVIDNAFTEVVSEKIDKVSSQVSLTIVNEANLPTNPIETNKYKNVILYFLLSFVLICGIIILLAYIDNTAQTVEDVEKELGYSVIGIIPKMDIK